MTYRYVILKEEPKTYVAVYTNGMGTYTYPYYVADIFQAKLWVDVTSARNYIQKMQPQSLDWKLMEVALHTIREVATEYMVHTLYGDFKESVIKRACTCGSSDSNTHKLDCHVMRVIIEGLPSHALKVKDHE